MSGKLVLKKFREVDLNDPFFDSLKSDYREFTSWFERKKDEEAYLFYDRGSIQGFLYFKKETGPVTDVQPVIEGSRILKIGTFKINPHGTRLGERFLKKTLDYALIMQMEKCYVTIFERHKALIDLFEKYGFYRHGIKVTENGTELVLVKSLTALTGDIIKDYPLISIKGNNKYVLSIYPKYHSIMFPDSILKNESVDILEDVSYTNSIHKIYVTRMKVHPLKRGDILVIYRTRDEGKSAEYSSVVSSICVVEDVRYQSDFENFEDFYSYATKYSVFDRTELKEWFDAGGSYTIKMTYNAALSKRLIRRKLIEEIGIERDMYWGFFQITDDQFIRILKEGGVLESIVID